MDRAPIRVLLLERDPEHAARLQALLPPAEFTVSRTTGAEDVVLFALGEEAGLEALARLGAARPIVVLAGQAEEALAREALQGHAQDYLIKEQATAALLERSIRYAMERHRLRRAVEHAEASSSAKTSFLARMSHEIRTPMTVVLGMADLLSRTALTAEQAKYVRSFRSAGDHLLQIIDDLLDLSKVEAGHLELDRVSFDLQALIREVVELLGPKAQQRGLEVGWKLAPEAPRALLGDPRRLKQVLINLVGNAIKFTDRGQVWLRVELVTAEPAILRFSVSDTGIGIPPGRLSDIFDNFIQVDASRRHQGAGLGLAVSRRLVEAMGGHLEVESEPGFGSIFSFQAGFERASQVPPVEPPRLAPPSMPRLRVLLVEDSPDNQLVIEAYLASLHCSLDVADNGRSAIQKLSSGDYDLVLMDVHLPVMDGLTATRVIRRLEHSTSIREIPIIAISADAFPEARLQAMAAGCTDYLTKPVEWVALGEALARHTRPGIGRAPVQPPHLAPLVPRYLSRRFDDLGSLLTALGRRDFETIGELGHKMKGSGASYGFAQISEIGRSLEQAAADHDAFAVQGCLCVFEQLLESVGGMAQPGRQP